MPDQRWGSCRASSNCWVACFPRARPAAKHLSWLPGSTPSLVCLPALPGHSETNFTFPERMRGAKRWTPDGAGPGRHMESPDPWQPSPNTGALAGSAEAHSSSPPFAGPNCVRLPLNVPVQLGNVGPIRSVVVRSSGFRQCLACSRFRCRATDREPLAPARRRGKEGCQEQSRMTDPSDLAPDALSFATT